MDVSEELVELTEESERLEEEDVENAVTVFEAVSMNLRGVENETEEVLDNLFVTVNQLLLAGETELMEAQMKAKTSSRYKSLFIISPHFVQIIICLFEHVYTFYTQLYGYNRYRIKFKVFIVCKQECSASSSFGPLQTNNAITYQ